MDEDGWDDRLGVPTSNRDQECTFCCASRPEFAHRLDARFVAFRCYGAGYTLPSFWATCAECEQSVVRGDDAVLLAHLVSNDVDGFEELGAASLDAFRKADLGPIPLADDR